MPHVAPLTISMTALLLALLVISSNRPFRAIILLGAFSITMATYYYVLGAPDVAMAEATLGAVFTTLIYVIAIKHTGSIKVAYTHNQTVIQKIEGKLTGEAHQIISNLEKKTGIKAEWTKIAIGNPDTAFDFDILILGKDEIGNIDNTEYVKVREWGNAIMMVRKDDEDLLNALTRSEIK